MFCNVLYFCLIYFFGIYKNCLFFLWSFLIFWFFLKDSSLVLVLGCINLILSFFVYRKEKCCYLSGNIDSECGLLFGKL